MARVRRGVVRLACSVGADGSGESNWRIPNDRK